MAYLRDLQLAGTATGRGFLNATASVLSRNTSLLVPSAVVNLAHNGAASASGWLVGPGSRAPALTAGIYYQLTVTDGTSALAAINLYGYVVANGDV